MLIVDVRLFNSVKLRMYLLILWNRWLPSLGRSLSGRKTHSFSIFDK